jgi:large subunit ribosomal protein L6
MSRIGKLPVEIPQNVEVKIDGDMVFAKGPKGELSLKFEPEFVSISSENGLVVVNRKNDEKASRARHGLYRSLIQNLMIGVTEGYAKKMEIKGVGYRGAMKGSSLELSLGFSHPINYDIPADITIQFEEKSQNIFTISGIDKQKVGQVSAEIRGFKKPEPYKGKGIRYFDEEVVRKAGKTASK